MPLVLLVFFFFLRPFFLPTYSFRPPPEHTTCFFFLNLPFRVSPPLNLISPNPMAGPNVSIPTSWSHSFLVDHFHGQLDGAVPDLQFFCHQVLLSFLAPQSSFSFLSLIFNRCPFWFHPFFLVLQPFRQLPRNPPNSPPQISSGLFKVCILYELL